MGNIFSLGICCHRTIWKAVGQKGVHKGKVLGDVIKGTRVLLKKQTHQNKRVHEAVCSSDSSLLKARLFLGTLQPRTPPPLSKLNCERCMTVTNLTQYIHHSQNTHQLNLRQYTKSSLFLPFPMAGTATWPSQRRRVPPG